MQYLEPEIFMEPENYPKRPGRPPIGEGTKLGLRIRPELEDAIDSWIAQQDDPALTKPEAIRRLLWKALRQNEP
jgi:hypothetical protein